MRKGEKMYPETRKVIQSLIQEGIIPGASYAFVKGNTIQHYLDGLTAIFPQEEEIKEDLLYDVASLTKVMMTTTVVLQLMEERKIVVDDSIQKYLTEFSSPDVTIRHLLTHTSAINGYIPNRDALSASELKQALMQLPVGENSGKEVVYTDTGMILLGFMIEKIEQLPLQQVFNKRILQPLKLEDSTFEPIDASRCAPTELHSKRGLIRGEVHDPKAFVLKGHCGSAGLFSSLKDCLTFAQMMLNKGESNGVRILKEKTVEGLLKDWTPTGDLWRSLGWNLKGNKEHPILFHTGFTGTFMIIDVLEQKAFVFLSNRVHSKSHTPTYLEKRDMLIDTYLKEKRKEENYSEISF